jgi:hypothetical protein
MKLTTLRPITYEHDVLSDDTRKSDQVQNEMTSLTIMDGRLSDIFLNLFF